MTRAMDALLVTRARFRRRYGNDTPEHSTPSRFLGEIPGHLIEDLSAPVAGQILGRLCGQTTYGPNSRRNRGGSEGDRQWSYEDEDQSSQSYAASPSSREARNPPVVPQGIPSITSRSFLPREGRNFRDRKSRFPMRPAAQDFAMDNAFDIRNTEREWSSTAKEKGKMQRLRYNF